MPKISKRDLPAFVRKCYDAAQRANKENRDCEVERLRFYVGGEGQWKSTEIEKRKNAHRPIISVNKCKPAVDQIEGDIRLNPPGPACHPVGGGADKDTADIIEGLIREVEYRSGAKTAYSTAGKYSAASGYGVLELATEFVDERSFAQRLVINSVEDPSIVFFDPSARMANRQDAMWAGKLKMYQTREDYAAVFGDKRRVLQPRGVQTAMGWIQDAMGVKGSLAQINEWTGAGEGPFYVCEFYMVEVENEKLTLYSDNIARFPDEAQTLPRGVVPKPGDEYSRIVPRRKITKHVVDALEAGDDTEWQGDLIPLFPVLGPEIYIEGKLHRLSLIAGAIDPQRALNYVATTATELAGLLPKSPYLGPKGSFDDPRWQTANAEMWAYLEYTPVFATDETTGQQHLAPAPQRNMWEAPIQWLIVLGQYFSDAIKAVTSIYDPSLGQQKNDQSGKAIEQLRSESSVGTFSYADNLHRAVEVMYQQMCVIFPKIMDGPRAATIIRADSQHEMKEINRDFPGGVNPATGKKESPLNIALGQYAVRVNAGPSFKERQEKAVAMLNEFFKANPAALGSPGVAAAYMRLIGEGNPKVEQMADLLQPGGNDEEMSPEQMQAQLMQAQQQSQQQQQIIEKMQQVIMAKLPEVEAQKWKAELDALTKIYVAEINSSKDADKAGGDRLAALLQQMLSMGHDKGMAAMQQGHEREQADTQRGHEQQMAQIPPPIDPNAVAKQPNGAA